MAKQHSISLIDSCSSSQEISQNSLLINPNLSSTIESSKAGEEGNEVQKSQKRRSIGDLVERYKKILQERDSKWSSYNCIKNACIFLILHIEVNIYNH